MQTYADLNSPRHQLTFEKLPRGFFKFPDHIVQGMAERTAQYGYGAEYARRNLIYQTLVWFYDGLPVAYREHPDGIEVLALGFEETARYELHPEEGVKVVQP
jgi:hypothetical protein